jgi:amino acid transporter
VLAIVTATLGQRAGKAALLLTVAAMWFCGLSTVTSVLRIIYALARDQGLPLAKVWSRTSARHQTPGPAIWLSVALAFAALVYSGSYAAVTSLSVVGCYLAYILPVYLVWRRKPQWIDKRGPWHLGRQSDLINALALVWTVSICTIMIMPPNAQAAIGMAVVLGVLFVFHRLTGPHEIRKPVWIRAETPVASNSEI